MEGVISVDSKRIIVYEPKDHKHEVYLPPQSSKSNQEMCQRIRVVVDPKQVIKTRRCYNRMSIKL